MQTQTVLLNFARYSGCIYTVFASNCLHLVSNCKENKVSRFYISTLDTESANIYLSYSSETRSVYSPSGNSKWVLSKKIKMKCVENEKKNDQ